MALFYLFASIWGCKNGVVAIQTNSIPIIDSIIAVNNSDSTAIQLICKATDADGDELLYFWSCADGSIMQNGSSTRWIKPIIAGDYTVSVKVIDNNRGNALRSKIIAVRGGKK